MAKTFRVVERGQYAPHRCIITGVTGKPDAPLIDLNSEAEFYGRVYISYNIFVALADQLGFVTPEVASVLRKENDEMKKRLNRIPAVTERLVNDIRDISISASAELLSDSTPVVLVDDKKSEQSDTRANLDYFGDNKPSENSSEPVVDEGPAGLPADNGSKRKPSAKPATSSAGNR